MRLVCEVKLFVRCDRNVLCCVRKAVRIFVCFVKSHCSEMEIRAKNIENLKLITNSEPSGHGRQNMNRLFRRSVPYAIRVFSITGVDSGLVFQYLVIIEAICFLDCLLGIHENIVDDNQQRSRQPLCRTWPPAACRPPVWPYHRTPQSKFDRPICNPFCSVPY